MSSSSSEARFAGAFFLIFILLAIASVAARLGASVHSAQAALRWMHSYRFAIALIVLAIMVLRFFVPRRLRWSDYWETAFERATEAEPYEFEYQSAEDVILSLEKTRIEHGYMPGWLYYRCAELGLEDVLDDLRRSGRIAGHQAERSDSSASSEDQETSAIDDPYEVLGVQPTSSQEEIRKAYRELVKLYHPDRVHGLGPELQKFAKDKTAQLNAAYEQLERKEH